MKLVSIIIPAYNEAESIASVLEDINEVISSLSSRAEEGDSMSYTIKEVVVVDDCSTDNTGDEAARCDVRVIRHSRNMGYGAALKTGVRYTDSEVVLMMDADGQHNPQDIPLFLRQMERYEAVLGNRSKHSPTTVSRKWGKRLLRFVANWLTGVDIPDLNCGYRALRRDVINNIIGILPNGFSFSTTMTIALLRTGYNITFLPVHADRRIGTSTVSSIDGFKTLLLILRIIMLFSPLRIFLPVSGVLGVFGGAYLVNDLLQRNISDTSVLLLLSSIIIFLFGLLADQLASVRREISRHKGV